LLDPNRKGSIVYRVPDFLCCLSYDLVPPPSQGSVGELHMEGGGGSHFARERGWGDPNHTTAQNLWYSLYDPNHFASANYCVSVLPRGTKRCRLYWLTNSALVNELKCGGGGELRVSANEYSLHRSPKKFGNLTPYLTYVLTLLLINIYFFSSKKCNF
jgi:hypothetical protein